MTPSRSTIFTGQTMPGSSCKSSRKSSLASLESDKQHQNAHRMKIDFVSAVLLMGMSKITSAIDDIYEIESENVFKGNVKHSVLRFKERYEALSNPLLTLYYDKNSVYIEEIVSSISATSATNDDSVVSKMRSIHAKIASSVNDFSMLSDNPDLYMRLFSEKVILNVTKLTNQGFWNAFINSEQYISMVTGMDSFSKTIYSMIEEHESGKKVPN